MNFDKKNKKTELIIVRGASGSGKSTFVKKKFNNLNWFEADMFFEESGVYKFDRSKLHEAHNWCQTEVKRSLESNHDTVVSNTFIKMWEMQYYLDLVNILNIDVKVYRLTTQFDNIHNVPDEVVKKMINNFEGYDKEIIIGKLK